MGLGAIIAYALRTYAYAEREGLDAHLVSSSPLYCERGKSDFFADFFLRSDLNEQEPLPFLAREWLFHFGLPARLSIAAASEIFKRKFRPNSYLTEALKQQSDNCEKYDLSIHYRATDKVAESGVVPYEIMIEVINRLLPRDGVERNVFLATDDASFSNSIRQRFNHVRFLSFDLGEVEDGKPRHFSSLSPHDKALEALVNIFCISRSPKCVRTSSYLSAMSMIVNPAMESHTVNWTLTDDLPFPEREIRDRELGG